MEQLVQKLNDEYANFKFYQLEELSECTDYICAKQAYIDRYILSALYQQKTNNRDFKLSSFLSCIPLVKVFKTPDFFQEDSLDIDLSIEISMDYLNYFNKLFEVHDDGNYEDVAKLAAFMGDLYNYNLRQLEENRARRERFYYGEEEFGICELVNKNLVDEFFQQQIMLVCKNDSVEKVKK